MFGELAAIAVQKLTTLWNGVQTYSSHVYITYLHMYVRSMVC